MELKKEQIDFTHLYKVTKINNDEVSFRKYSIKKSDSMINFGFVTVSLDKEEGDEIYHVTPEVNEMLIGKVGDLIKGIKGKIYGRKRKSFIVCEIVEIKNTTLNQFENKE